MLYEVIDMQIVSKRRKCLSKNFVISRGKFGKEIEFHFILFFKNNSHI